MLGDLLKEAGISSNSFKSSKKNKEKQHKTQLPKKIKEQNNIASNTKLKKEGVVKLKLTAISPIHIGSGEVYEPTNFVIDKNILYHFRDEDFFMALDKNQQDNFMRIILEKRSDSFSRINKFVKNNIEIAKKVSFLTVKTTDGIQKEYNNKIGKISQIEGHRGNYTNVFNKFEIQRIQRKQLKSKDKYVYMGYIPGSSLKGAISTAYREFVYKTEGKTNLYKNFEDNRNIQNHIFGNLKVSDSKVTKIGTTIGYACNKERFEDDDSGMATFIEIIDTNSEFIIDVNYKDLDIKQILNSCNEHYLAIFKSIFSSNTNGKEEFINEYLTDDFYDKYKDFNLKENQYLIRVGKHSGARAVTIDGLRDISIKESKYRTLQHQKEETTTWLFGEDKNSVQNLLPFGWLLCEIL